MPPQLPSLGKSSKALNSINVAHAPSLDVQLAHVCTCTHLLFHRSLFMLCTHAGPRGAVWFRQGIPLTSLALCCRVSMWTWWRQTVCLLSMRPAWVAMSPVRRCCWRMVLRWVPQTPVESWVPGGQCFFCQQECWIGCLHGRARMQMDWSIWGGNGENQNNALFLWVIDLPFPATAWVTPLSCFVFPLCVEHSHDWGKRNERW